ncbi:histidine kinase 1 [Actinidia rufa]|uniref:histidine kinase n=1 Tax=Actinidia rufa TaxID=165716 RepID=A0A7J0F118_9ERIC|nr:histidine kinase 1 [Actinidia rufa]
MGTPFWVPKCHKERDTREWAHKWGLLLCLSLLGVHLGYPKWGIDPSKWESGFESFELVDPSATGMHGGTRLGICIVRTLVNKMGGETKVVKKKNGPGTLMKLYLLLNIPQDTTGDSIVN